VTDLKPVAAAARDLLIAGNDRWLWEHTRRVTHAAQGLALLPEVREGGGTPPDPQTVAVAALFADAGWAVQVQRGSIEPWEVLNRPTGDIQRELGAAALHEHAVDLLPAGVIETASRAIRECNEKYTKLPEAQTLREAENLDEIGVLYVLRQFRRWQHQPGGHSLQDLVAKWRQLLEYSFWETEINLGLRWEASRQIARARLQAVEQFMVALARDSKASDLHNRLADEGIDTSSLFNPPA